MNEKELAREMLLRMMKASLERSKINVVQPLPLVEEKAKQRLTTDDYISWRKFLDEWKNVSDEGKKTISLLLLLNSHTLVEAMDCNKRILDEHKDTASFVEQHPEFGKPEDKEEDFMQSFKDLFE